MTTVMSRDKMNSLASLIGDTKSFVSQADIDRMRDIARPEAEREAERVAAIKAAKASTLAKADARKAKMIELEAQRKLAVPPSEVEALKMAEKAAMLSAADRQMAEELDDVKKMNQMMLYSKVVTIRDAQLNEKKVIQKERLEDCLLYTSPSPRDS